MRLAERDRDGQMKSHSYASTIPDVGHVISKWVADAAAQPLSQAAVIGFCILWWSFGLPTGELTATLSILAITLTQMVLNRQRMRESDDHRRDIAMHAKLDELLRAEQHARKELAGIEELETEEIAELKLRLSREYSRPAAAGNPRPSVRQ